MIENDFVLTFIEHIKRKNYLVMFHLPALDHQNRPKPILHCSNFVKIIFWAWEGVKCPKLKNVCDGRAT